MATMELAARSALASVVFHSRRFIAKAMIPFWMPLMLGGKDWLSAS